MGSEEAILTPPRAASLAPAGAKESRKYPGSQRDEALPLEVEEPSPRLVYGTVVEIQTPRSSTSAHPAPPSPPLRLCPCRTT